MGAGPPGGARAPGGFQRSRRLSQVTPRWVVCKSRKGAGALGVSLERGLARAVRAASGTLRHFSPLLRHGMKRTHCALASKGPGHPGSEVPCRALAGRNARHVRLHLLAV